MKAILSATDISKKLEILNHIQTKYPNIHFLLHKDNVRLDLHIIKHIDEAFELPINSILYLTSETDIKKSESIELFYEMLDKYIISFSINQKDKYVLIIQGLFKECNGISFKGIHIQIPNQKTLCFIKEI